MTAACDQHANQILSRIVTPLLRWYRATARVLPWREEPSPYFVWVSEIMLQQTRVEAVKPYFDRFVEALPTIAALAACPEEQLLKLWEGLGYYTRVRNLQKTACILVEQQCGQLPNSFDALQKLPGIGDYTAGAIASIAFGQTVPAVDGNVLRVLSRVLASAEDVTRKPVKDSFRAALQAVEPEGEAGDFNQALMELGAMICLPNGAPKCGLCPLQDLCKGSAGGDPAKYPHKPPKKPRKKEERTIFLVLLQSQSGKQVLLHRRPEPGLLAGMWEFPGTIGTEPADQAREFAAGLGLTMDSCTKAGLTKHIFTHIEWQMSGWFLQAEVSALPPLPDAFTWADREELALRYTLPSAFRYYLDFLRDQI